MDAPVFPGIRCGSGHTSMIRERGGGLGRALSGGVAWQSRGPGSVVRRPSSVVAWWTPGGARWTVSTAAGKPSSSGRMVDSGRCGMDSGQGTTGRPLSCGRVGSRCDDC
jgi:hypothetical protein